MKKIFTLLLLSLCLVGCADDDSGEMQEFTVYSHLDSGEPTVLNSIADLSSYIDLYIDVSDPDIAIASYDWEGEGFIITPLKEGRTIVTVREKHKLKYKIKVVVEYEGAGNWELGSSKIIVDSDADIKETIEQDVLKNSLFYNYKENSLYASFFFENEYARLVPRESSEGQSTIYRFIKETQHYEFSLVKPRERKYLYQFDLHFKSPVGIMPQHKIGSFCIDKTKEYQEKYPDKNVWRVTEQQYVECYYNPN